MKCYLLPLVVVGFIVRAMIDKPIEVVSIIPDEIEKYPWAGHLGLRLIHKVIPILEGSKTTLIFINTRGMSETWYQSLLTVAPDLAGAIALHHGSIDMELRNWVEEALHEGKLKAVVCTASLDLGVDFRPVETVVQVGSPKGVARFLQRAGRSGHQPGQVSKIHFLPTHSLELVEAAALKAAMQEGLIESREPMLLCYDVLIQYLGTLAISEGFRPEVIYPGVEIDVLFCGDGGGGMAGDPAFYYRRAGRPYSNMMSSGRWRSWRMGCIRSIAGGWRCGTGCISGRSSVIRC